jgi:putative tryptophan/tyrosine transport system substrate-binding protein
VLQRGLALTSAGLLVGCGVGLRPTSPALTAHRIGYLTGLFVRDPGVEAFRGGLRDLGYVERQSITIEAREAAGQQDRLPELAAELIGLGVELIVTPVDSAAEVVRTRAPDLPVVLTGAADPVGRGLAASLA